MQITDQPHSRYWLWRISEVERWLRSHVLWPDHKRSMSPSIRIQPVQPIIAHRSYSRLPPRFDRHLYQPDRESPRFATDAIRTISDTIAWRSTRPQTTRPRSPATRRSVN